MYMENFLANLVAVVIMSIVISLLGFCIKMIKSQYEKFKNRDANKLEDKIGE